MEARAARPGRGARGGEGEPVRSRDRRGHLRRAADAGLCAAEPGRAESGGPARSADSDPTDDAAARFARTRSISAAPPRSRMTNRSTPRSAAGRRLPAPDSDDQPLPTLDDLVGAPRLAAAQRGSVAVVVVPRPTGAGLDDRALTHRARRPHPPRSTGCGPPAWVNRRSAARRPPGAACGPSRGSARSNSPGCRASC